MFEFYSYLLFHTHIHAHYFFQAIEALVSHEDTAWIVVPLVVDASTAPDLQAIKLSGNFHGGDTGNYDQCHGVLSSVGFHHCLAGSTNLEHSLGVVSSPFAGLCVPQVCSYTELQDSLFSQGLHQIIHDFNKYPQNVSEGAFEQGNRYLYVIKETLAVASYLRTGFTCGDHAYPDMEQNHFAFIVMCALLSLVMAAIVSSLSRYVKKLSTTPQSPLNKSDESYQMNEHDLKTLEVERPAAMASSTSWEIFESTFNFRQNAIKIIFTVNNDERGNYRAFDALRVLSILW